MGFWGFGDLIREAQANTAASDPTRGIVFGAYSQQNSASYNIIQYVTIATLGNAQDFGDLSVPRYAVASLSSVTRAITAGGYDASTYYNIIEYVTIQTLGDATNFGDLTTLTGHPGAVSNSIRGVFGGGYISPADANTNVMEFITIASTGNAADFGDLLSAARQLGGISDSHGGLGE